MIGKYETITEEDIISAAKMKLRLTETTVYDDYLSFLIQEGVRHLGTLSLFIKHQCDLNIIDRKTELPKGFYRLIGLRFKTDEVSDTIPEGGPFFTNNCRGLIYVDTKFLNYCGCNTTMGGILPYMNTFQIVGNFIHYNSDVNVDTVTLAYLGFNLDKKGRMIIYADYERALTAYCCWNFTLSYSDEYKEATIERWERQWKAQKSWIKGLDASNDFQQTKAEVSEMVNALLVSNTVNW